MIYLKRDQKALEDEIDMLKGKDLSQKQYYQLRFKRIMKRRKQEVQSMYFLIFFSLVYLGFVAWLSSLLISIEAIIPVLFGLLSLITAALWLYFKNFPRDAFIAKTKRQIAAEYREFHQTE